MASARCACIGVVVNLWSAHLLKQNANPNENNSPKIYIESQIPKSRFRKSRCLNKTGSAYLMGPGFSSFRVLVFEPIFGVLAVECCLNFKAETYNSPKNISSPRSGASPRSGEFVSNSNKEENKRNEVPVRSLI